MGEKKGNSKLLWYIVFALLTVVMCYFFVVIYFHYISPYSISNKLTFWPFTTQSQMEEMYKDAVVEINFSVENEDFETEDKTVLGVTIRKDGFVVAPFNELKQNQTENGFKVLTNYGVVYSGEIVFADQTLNLAILKCQHVGNAEKAVKMAYAKIGGISNHAEGDEIVAISSSNHKRSPFQGEISSISETNCIPASVDGVDVAEFVLEDGFLISLDLGVGITNFPNGAIFNKKGEILGFCFQPVMSDDALDSDQYYVMSTEGACLFVDNVVSQHKKGQTYSNSLVDAVVGVDQTELVYHMSYGDTQFYFNGEWNNYSSSIEYYSSTDLGGVYLLKDLVYGGKTIEKDCVVTKIKYQDETYALQGKIELIWILYQMEKGDVLTVYYEFLTNLASEPRSVTITV